MSDGKSRFRTLPMISALALMLLLVSAVPSALAYSPAWGAMTPLIEDKSQAVVIADNANDTVYIIGGGLGIAGAQFSTASDSVIAYNVKTGESSRVAPMTQGVRGACGGLGENGKIYVFSGFNSTNLATTQIYDIATGTWSTGTDIPSVVFKGDCVVAWPEFYVFGWSGPDTQVQVFSTLNNSWYIGVPLPEARQSGAAVYNEMEDAIYFMGGKDGGDVSRDTLFRFDMDSGVWTTKKHMLNNLTAFDAAVGSDGLIYAVGGTDIDYPFTTEAYPTGYYYCPNNDTWYSLPDMGSARKFLGVVALPEGKILAMGGNNDTAILDNVESLDLVDATPALAPSLVGQGRSTVLTLDFDSYASQTKAYLAYYLKSESGAIYPEQNVHFAAPGTPSVIIDIPQSMPADNYTLIMHWTLIFETGTIALPEETVGLVIFQTVPLPDQISELNANLTAELNSQLGKIISLEDQNDQLSQQITDLQDQLNQTKSGMDGAMDLLEDKTDDAINAANSASTFAMLGVVLALIIAAVVIINMVMSRKK